MERGGPITFDQVGCARCNGDGHPGITFLPFTYPVRTPNVREFTHWAPCPTNGEPILLLIVPKANSPQEHEIVTTQEVNMGSLLGTTIVVTCSCGEKVNIDHFDSHSKGTS